VTRSSSQINLRQLDSEFDSHKLYHFPHVDPNNVPLASLVAQEEHVDVNYIRNNNFNNSAYRNNFASNNYRSYPSNSDNGCLGRPKMQ
jgi:hypothetical protein